MNVLEKILEEIEEKFKTADAEKCDCEELCDVEDWYDSGYIDGQLSAHEKCMDIIRSHMDDVPKCGECSRRKFYMQGYEDGKKNDGWIPVSEKLPEVGKMVKVTVHSSGWIADYDSAWVPEEEKTYHSEEYGVYDGYLSRAGKWRFYDDQYSESTCVKEFGTDKGTVYDVVTAWMPKEQIEPYKEG